MLIAPAMGVRQDFYAPVARFFARHGVHVLTFDYRGVGASRRGRLAALDADLADWAAKDFDAMLAEAQRADSRLPLVLLGHSLGGQILGIAPSNARVRAAIHVTAGSGYYGFNERMRLRVRLLWFVVIPLATRLAGYFPGRALGVIGDLPRGVALQWRRWCLDPEYLLADGPAARAAFERVRCPILSWSFEDDAMLPRRAIESLNGFYRNARIEHRHATPGEVRAARVGHFGYFSERQGVLWSESLAWLRAALPEP